MPALRQSVCSVLRVRDTQGIQEESKQKRPQLRESTGAEKEDWTH